MFNLFRKNKTAPSSNVNQTTKLRNHSYDNQLIEQIHNEFYTSGDTLLLEVTKALTGKEKLINKADRLSELGFKKSVDVVEAMDLKISKELQSLVMYYLQKYPTAKFITEEQVAQINQKYGLVCAPVDRYLGFVPETKISQIESFKLDVKDAVEKTAKLNFQFENTVDKDGIANLRKTYPLDIVPLSLAQQGTIRGFGGGYGTITIRSYDILDTGKLHICAPKKDLDLTGLISVGEKMMSYTKVEIPDPVVLQPVKGGYLILAAWGDEASDPIVLNPNNN